MNPLDYINSLIEGQSISSTPVQKSELFLLMQFLTPNTASYITTKLLHTLYSDGPPTVSELKLIKRFIEKE